MDGGDVEAREGKTLTFENSILQQKEFVLTYEEALMLHTTSTTI